MANAWLLRPLPVTGAVTTAGTPQLGAGAYAFNDYAGVVCQLACDAGGAASIRFDLGSVQPIDALMVFGVELLPAGATVALSKAGSADGAYTQIAAGGAYAGTERLTSGAGVSVLDVPPTSARYLQVTFAGGAAVRLSRIVVGKRIQPERNYGFGAGFGVRDLGSLDFSPRGVLARRRGRKLRTASLTFSNLHRDEAEAQTGPLLELVGNTEPVALLTDPEAHALRERRAYFGPLVGDLSHVIRRADAYEAKCNLVSLF